MDEGNRNTAALQNVGEKSITMQKLNRDYQTALCAVDDMILKNYVTDLSQMEIVPLDKEALKNNIRDNVDFFKITEMVYEKEEEAVHKFASVFNTLALTESAVYVIINSDGVKTDFYMGVRASDEERTTSSLKNLVEKTLKGQFPGVKTRDYDTLDEVQEVLGRIKTNSIAAVTCVANNKLQQEHTNANFVQGLEKTGALHAGRKIYGNHHGERHYAGAASRTAPRVRDRIQPAFLLCKHTGELYPEPGAKLYTFQHQRNQPYGRKIKIHLGKRKYLVWHISQRFTGECSG